jgi:tetratricopeptide (TPR) repeat protein
MFCVAGSILGLAVCLALIGEDAIAASEQVLSLNNDGVNALRANNYELAASKFQQCMKIDPTFKVASENLASCFNSWGIALQNSPKQAIEKFHKSLFYEPANEVTNKNRQSAIQNMGKDPHSFQDLVSLGKEASLRGDREGCIVEYSAALQIKDDPAVRVELGNAYYLLARIDDAIDQYNTASRCADLDPETRFEIYRNLGHVYREKKDHVHSAEAYGLALKVNHLDPEMLAANKMMWAQLVQNDPLNPSNHAGLGQAFLYINQLENKSLNRADELQKRKLTYDDDRQEVMLLGGPFEPSNAELHAILQADQCEAQSPSGIYLKFASVFQANGKYRSAIQYYEKALQLKPDNAAAREGLKESQEQLKYQTKQEAIEAEGDRLFSTGKLEDVLKYYQAALAADSPSPSAQFNVALAPKQWQELDEAISEFKVAVKLAPDNKQFRENLARATQEKTDIITQNAIKMHAKKEYTSAINLYLQSLSLVPNNTAVILNLAECYYANQEYSEARKYYEKVHEADPKSFSPHR